MLTIDTNGFQLRINNNTIIKRIGSCRHELINMPVVTTQSRLPLDPILYPCWTECLQNATPLSKELLFYIVIDRYSALLHTIGPCPHIHAKSFVVWLSRKLFINHGARLYVHTNSIAVTIWGVFRLESSCHKCFVNGTLHITSLP